MRHFITLFPKDGVADKMWACAGCQVVRSPNLSDFL